LGAPFIKVDWDVAKQPATTGRMLSLALKVSLNQGGSKWNEGLASTLSWD